VKLAIVDGRSALVSLTLDPGRVTALVTSSAPLVDALRQLFEFHWARSLPLGDARDDAQRGESPPRGPVAGAGRTRDATAEERTLLALMAVGMKDDTIARQLGISPRTLRRRTQDLMVALEADTRFQAGLEAARRGWL
jgi:DNA-binding NarL/FixJ family response regulator